MNVNKISHKLSNLGLPQFWQYIIVLHVLLTFSTILISDPFWIHTLTLILKPLTAIGVITGYLHHTKEPFPWAFLVGAVVIIGIAMILDSLIFFGLDLNQVIPFWIEQLGILLIGLFGVNLLFLFEKRNDLNGFTLDFTLLGLSAVFFILLISPDYLNTVIFELTFEQQLALFHLVISIEIFLLVILNFIFTSSVQFKDIILFLLVIIVSFHFFFEAAISLNLVDNIQIYEQLSWIMYQIAGSLSVITIFIEEFKLKFSSHHTSKTGSLFMWGASIFALVAIPIGAIYRWNLGLQQINPLLVAASSLLLSTIVILRFIVLMKKANLQRKKLILFATNDELTDAHNYFGFHEKYSITAKKNALIIAINIEDFKSINELYGRDFGDSILKSLSIRLKKHPNVKIVARTGIDTFLIFLQIPPHRVKKEVHALHQTLGVWDTINDQRTAVPLTFGSSHSLERIDAEMHIKQAEKALHIARNKRIKFYQYNDDLKIQSLHRHELRGILQQAIDYNYLPVHFQPIYNIEDGSLKALELLIRVQSKEHGLLFPGQFLEQAQAYGLLTSLTKVCVNMIAKSFKQLPNVTININMPSYILDDPIILEDFLTFFKEKKLPPNRFCIEVMEDEDIPADHLLDAVTKLKKIGFSIAMDDFGTGYSSLSRLSLLPFDSVKIDRSLLLAASSGNKAILESTISLIKRLGISAVVEGVETIEQLTMIRLLGADSVQGYLLSKPINMEKTLNIPLNAANIIEEF